MNGVVIEQIKHELLERLRGDPVTSEVVHEIGSRFQDFANALSNNDIRSLLRATTLIHHLVLNLTGNEDAEAVCDRLQELIPREIKKVTQPLARKELFFVWIGSIDSRSLRNISVWKQANPRYQVDLWFDSQCLLASHYRRLLRDREDLNLSTNGDLIKFQNSAYADLQSMIADGRSFDEALIEFLLRVGMGHSGRKLVLELEKARRLYQALARHLRLRDVQDHAAAIMDDEFRHYYLREIALRGNLAAASDILRLHVIQHFGGVYIDCDTLPSLDHVFVRTGSYCRQHNISFGFIDVLKSELYMQKIAPLIEFPELEDEPNNEAATRQSDMQAITDHLRSHYGEVVALIEQDIEALTAENAFRPLDEIWLFPQGLLLTGDPHNRNCFNNNFVIANPHSKAIRIILLEMRRRYHYLDRMGAVDIASEKELPLEESYWGRLINYRFDALDHRHNVTVILTGPGLIFEAILGLGFSLLKLDAQVSPISLSYVLYSPKIGIAFTDQTFYTYDHSQSTWMRTPDGHALMV
jgi:hypothetical protein